MGTFAGATFCTHVPLLQTYNETFRREFNSDYENAIGTGQTTIWFDGGTP